MIQWELTSTASMDLDLGPANQKNDGKQCAVNTVMGCLMMLRGQNKEKHSQVSQLDLDTNIALFKHNDLNTFISTNPWSLKPLGS